MKTWRGWLLPWLLLCGFELTSVLWGTSVLGGELMRAPVEERHGGGAGAQTPWGSVLGEAMHFFRTTISPVDGDRCPMYPTCSQYGEMALARHGALVGLMLLVDRLFHEWSETTLAPEVMVHGVRRYWDPLEENDFWFADPGKRAERMP